MNKINKLTIALLALVVVISLSFSAHAAELMAGAAKADITPDVKAEKVPMGGYGARSGKPSTGVHDPVMAKVLYLRSGSADAVIVTTDLVGISPEVRNKVLEQVRDLGLDDHNLLMTASHTHSGPAGMEKNFIMSLIFGGYHQNIVDNTANRISQAIREAQNRLAPATLRAGMAQVPDATRNRRTPAYNYDTRRFSKDYNPSDPNMVTDPTLTVLRVDGPDGKPISVLVHFAMHATVLGADNFLISADWPGVMQRTLEEQYPGTVVMFMNGAEGDQAPNMPDDPDDFKCIDIIGKKIADAARPLIDSAAAVSGTPLRTIMVHRVIPMVGKVGIPEGPIKATITIPKSLMKKMFPDMPLQAVRVGDVVFMACPLEMISEIGQSMKSAAVGAGYKVPIVAGLANDAILYCTTPDEYDKGGYEAGNTIYGRIEAGLVIGEQTMLVRKLKSTP